MSVMLGNFASWSEGNYFIMGYRVVALNHLWSTAVEEQFYLIYPFVLWLVLLYGPQRRLAFLVEQSLDADRDLQMLEARGLVQTWDLKRILCPNDLCRFQSSGKPLYRDDNHLSLFGADYAAAAIEPWFERLLSAAR
jgi:hypothetical protein